MKLTQEIKDRIDSMTYVGLLSRWRFAPIGDPMFEGESGEYFMKVMTSKKAELDTFEQVAASKSVGWEK